MARRLRHSRAGFLARVAMSKDNSLFVLVEGKVVDPYFADRICASSESVSAAGYEILPITHVSSASGAGAGGKEAIVGFFEYCKSVRKLSQVNSAGTRRIAFLVDRDAQHLTGGKKRNDHVIYTYYADSEAHVFFECHEMAALGIAASLDEDSGEELVSALGDWKQDLAVSWRPWIELCCIATATGSSSRRVGFGKQHSLIHDPPQFRNLNARLEAEVTKDVRDRSPLTDGNFETVKTRITAKIERIYCRGLGASLLKGKWLPQQLEYLVDDFFVDPLGVPFDWDKEGFRRSVTRCYMAALTVNGPGATYIRSRFERLV
jgi:hypothetical protein